MHKPRPCQRRRRVFPLQLVQQALPHLQAGGTTLILYGDVPLIQAETLKRLLQAAQDALAILTVELADTRG